MEYEMKTAKEEVIIKLESDKNRVTKRGHGTREEYSRERTQRPAAVSCVCHPQSRSRKCLGLS